MVPEIVISNAPLLKAISADVAALRGYFVWSALVLVVLAGIAIGLGREFTFGGFKLDVSKVGPPLCLAVFAGVVAGLFLAGMVTAGAISNYPGRLQQLDLSAARGAANALVVTELLEGGFRLDVSCAIDPATGAAFVGANLCWSTSGAQKLGMLLFAVLCGLTAILIFRAIYLRNGRRHDGVLTFAAILCIGTALIALGYSGLQVAIAAETTILQELRRAAAAAR